jgi:hypothetical protein
LQFDTKYQEFTPFTVPAGFSGPITGNSMRVDPNGKMVWSTTRNRSWAEYPDQAVRRL